MAVASILAQKGREVVTAPPDRSLQDVATILAERKIGAIVITDNSGRVLGMLSERDIVRVLAEQGASALMQPLAQVMTRKVFTCSPSETIGVIMERMTAGKFRHVPVIEQDQVVGVVSIGDVVKYRLQEMEHESAALRDYIQSA